ncbi:hypothetical protein [Yinghuangia aomiensis]
MTDREYSALFGVFRETGVLNREGFYLPTYDPESGKPVGGIDAHEFAHRLLAALGRCGAQEGTCTRCLSAVDDDS